MVTRRAFLGAVGAGLAAGACAAGTQAAPGPSKRMAIITTEWRYHSHAWHMGERFLVGFPRAADGTSPHSMWSPRTSISTPPTT
jgi:hypothetical protein